MQLLPESLTKKASRASGERLRRSPPRPPPQASHSSPRRGRPKVVRVRPRRLCPTLPMHAGQSVGHRYTSIIVPRPRRGARRGAPLFLFLSEGSLLSPSDALQSRTIRYGGDFVVSEAFSLEQRHRKKKAQRERMRFARCARSEIPTHPRPDFFRRSPPDRGRATL